jgi:hypothetical protein
MDGFTAPLIVEEDEFTETQNLCGKKKIKN